jgi:hypothetical protein
MADDVGNGVAGDTSLPGGRTSPNSPCWRTGRPRCGRRSRSGWDGVVDQAQAFFAAAQGSGDALVFRVGAGQVGIGVFQLRGAPAHPLVELNVLVLGQVSM